MHRLAMPPLAVVALCATAALVHVSFSSENDGAPDFRANNYVATRTTALVGHSFKVVRGRSRLRCAKLCLSLAECRSFNHGDAGGICQLNDERRDDLPEDFHPNQDFSYYEGYEITAHPNGAATPEFTTQNQISTTVNPKRPTTTGASTTSTHATTNTTLSTMRTYNPDADREYNPWWRVDLEGEHCISKVTILNRGNCCSQRTTHAVARAGFSTNVTRNMACGSPVTAEQAAPLGGLIEITCDPPLRARYVSIDIPLLMILNICEIMVEEVPLNQCPA